MQNSLKRKWFEERVLINTQNEFCLKNQNLFQLLFFEYY